jgi:uncharacterized protein (DUF433 family)
MSTTTPTVIIRTERGLTISGTRVTLYDVLGYLRAQWPHDRISAMLRLSDEQLDAALEYIAAHRAGVEAEYEMVLHSAAEARRYWEARNRERLAQIDALLSTTPPRPGTEALRAKLAERQAKRAAQEVADAARTEEIEDRED